MSLEIEKIWLYRIVHIHNVEYILRNGMFTKHHIEADPDYINIGDITLIEQRDDYPVPVNPPNGTLGDYIPFYFGPLSPMLLNIKTGYRGIIKRPQSDIVYICCKFASVKQHCKAWCFTDGHPKNVLTRFYNSEDSFHEIDWNMVRARYWRPVDEDYDRMRRKQAEFLVKDFLPVQCINCLVVYNEEKRAYIQDLVSTLNLNVNILVNPNSNFYY